MSKCPHCKRDIKDNQVLSWYGAIMGRRTSKAKAAASRENGKKGGRPRVVRSEQTGGRKEES